MKYGFGIDLGGTTVKIAYFNEAGKMLEKWEIPTDTSENGIRILPDIAASVRAFLTERKIADSDILGLGIGVPGPVNAKGVVNRCINLGWDVFNIAQKLTELTGFPVKAGNDANVAALGEFWKGGGQGCDNMVFVTLGTGVGGGIVVEGKLLHGAHGSGAEIGHLVLNRDETVPCNCGKRGCVEQYCSATGIVRLAKRHLDSTDAPSALRTLKNLTCKDIFDAKLECATFHTLLGENEEADALFKDLLDNGAKMSPNPNWINFYAKYSTSLVSSDQKAAMDLATKAAQLYPNDPDIHLARGSVAYMCHNPTEAIAVVRRCVS